ncbi:hybrid signal transduction histidine kinase M-like [Populus alba x Populus x berolinensis]|uniref:Hybrid signal transduction histidine kinase M-like n=1 Tax=Populus alba x Populus x berolinensis TaxID=444605 RepID=A0AAD6VWX8_9ROSI|nr:hybrid signal transduction histidine kinase M-like [Populus alba x Populus x berolinensis]
MDSGNSGSMQSSSGGDEEYDSRAESISAFLNNTTMLFDPLSNYFDPLSSASSRSPPPPFTNPNSLLNLDMVWSKNLRSEPNCTDLGGFISSSSPTQQLFTNQTQTRTTFQSLPPHGHESTTRGPVSVSGANDQVSNTAGVRNPKKRSRASRRAPTTVLTTDTTNFRAMVQEFTGIPAPPFTSSPFPRSRLDLFGTAASTLRSAVSHHLDPSPPPFQPPPPPAPPFASSGSTASSFSTSMVDAIASTTTTNINNSGACTNSTSTNISSTSINYQLPSDLGLFKQPHNLLNINVQNPILNFHPLLQAPHKYPLPNSTNILGTTKAQQGMGVLEEFGMSHGHVSTNLTGLQNIVSSSSSPSADATQQGLLRSINGNYNNSTQRVTNGKVNFLASSSSDFRGDNKGQENVAARSEGMMESWICSSD